MSKTEVELCRIYSRCPKVPGLTLGRFIRILDGMLQERNGKAIGATSDGNKVSIVTAYQRGVFTLSPSIDN